MTKDFDGWNEVKKKTDAEQTRFYTVREIWWCRFGVNVGTEQDGKGEWYVRPCVILRGFGPDACLVVPLTKSARKHALRISVGFIEGFEARANLSQMRVVDTRRLEAKIGFLEKSVFSKLRKPLKIYYSGFSISPPCGGEAEANCAHSVALST
jgi:mRNA interferase MazF